MDRTDLRALLGYWLHAKENKFWMVKKIWKFECCCKYADWENLKSCWQCVFALEMCCSSVFVQTMGQHSTIIPPEGSKIRNICLNKVRPIIKIDSLAQGRLKTYIICLFSYSSLLFYFPNLTIQYAEKIIHWWARNQTYDKENGNDECHPSICFNLTHHFVIFLWTLT